MFIIVYNTHCDILNNIIKQQQQQLLYHYAPNKNEDKYNFFFLFLSIINVSSFAGRNDKRNFAN